METLVVLLIAALLVLASVSFGLAHRVRQREAEHEAATSAVAAATGQSVPSIPAGVQQLIEQSSAARRREDVIRTAVEQVTAGVAVLDSKLAVVFATKNARHMLDGRHEDAAVAARIRDLAWDVVQSGRSMRTRFEVHGPDRRILALEADRLPADVMDGVVVQVRDVTEAERVHAMRQDFVANVSHELKTPVGGMQVLAEAIVETEDDVARKRLSARLVGEAERLAVLVDDILQLTHVEGDEPSKVDVDLVEVIVDAGRRVEVVAEQSHVELVTDVPNEAVVVLGDRAQLVSAVANLMDNAIKYGSVMGEQRAVVKIRLDREEGRAVVAVEDHGVGISEQHLPRIFERFYRVDRGRGRSRGGTGLGLAIVRHVALNHGGEVSVESTPGVGSLFRLSMPTVEA